MASRVASAMYTHPLALSLSLNACKAYINTTPLDDSMAIACVQAHASASTRLLCMSLPSVRKSAAEMIMPIASSSSDVFATNLKMKLILPSNHARLTNASPSSAIFDMYDSLLFYATQQYIQPNQEACARYCQHCRFPWRIRLCHRKACKQYIEGTKRQQRVVGRHERA